MYEDCTKSPAQVMALGSHRKALLAPVAGHNLLVAVSLIVLAHSHRAPASPKMWAAYNCTASFLWDKRCLWPTVSALACPKLSWS